MKRRTCAVLARAFNPDFFLHGAWLAPAN